MAYSILIVEDDKDILKNVEDRIKSMGHKFKSAKNKTGAMQLYEEHDFDLVILDLQIPLEFGLPSNEKNGLDILDEIREEKSEQDFPIIITSAMGKELGEDRFKFVTELIVDRKANDFISKPLVSSGKESLEQRLSNAIVKLEKHRKAISSIKQYKFSKNGDFWTIVFGSKTAFSVRDSKGMFFIEHLLSNKDKKITGQKLEDKLLKPTEKQSKAKKGEGEEMMSDEVREYHENRIGMLEAEIEKAREEGRQHDVDEAFQEIEEIQKLIKKAHGLGGKKRKINDPKEKLRQRISKNIRDSIKNIKEKSEPAAKYLKDNIDTGGSFSYHGDIVWNED